MNSPITPAQETAPAGDTNPGSIPQDLFEAHTRRYKGLNDVYLRFWPLGCEESSQEPNWELLDRKLSRFLESNEKIKTATTSAHKLHMDMEDRKFLDDFIRIPDELRSTSGSEIEVAWPISVQEELHAQSSHIVDTNSEQTQFGSESDYDWSLPETPPSVPALDGSWTIVANELHSARTTLCFTMDCGDAENVVTTQQEVKNDENHKSENI
ncbi:hypothetical protein N0V93_002518 [Gnomoniopsis smithogilvyi]|uniref:Uncharacterized protein n=1 Tax=Gnomoniopsis smithogilvyi TaxID=1191159 RepID=A0A9W9CXQ9_9PEZI|nr:hypothetical protein N0V93_002518 [Gnomoniopsis smithogilvyi]